LNFTNFTFDDISEQFYSLNLKYTSLLLMSTLTPTISLPPSDQNPPQNGSDKQEVVPKWGYGVIAGGSVAVVSAGLVAYHAISKNRRQKAAEVDAKTFNQDQITPRVAEPVSRFSPRPGEKIV
jgi:hypothetical protein